PASTTPYLSYLAAGTYTVTVTDRNGCTKSATYTITEPAQIQLSAVSTPTSCNGGANGSVDLTVTGGTSTITYQWSNGATTQDLSAVPAGTYTVFVADANNCTNSASYTVTEPSALAISATTQNVVCHGGTTGGVNITVSGGTPGYTYAWSNSSTTEDLSMIGIGDYSVTATDTKGCTIIGGAYSVTEPLLLNVDAVLTDVACNGTSFGAINITPFGGVSPYNYLWSNGAITQDISSIPAGTYTVTVTDNSSCTDVHIYTVAQPAQLTLMLTATNSTCNGSNNGMVVSSVGGGVTPYTYSWSSGQAASSISNRAPGTYGLTVTDDRGCQISGSKMLTEPAAIVITDAVQQVACNGGSTGAIDIGVTGGTSPYTYQWSNTATAQDLGSLRSLSYAVTITDSNGCVKDASYTVSEPAAISISATVTNPLCNGGTNGSVNLTVTGGTPAGTAPFYTYAWSGGQTAEDPTGLSAGTYTVTVTDANLCTAVYSVSLSQPDALAVTTQQTNCSCDMVNDGALDLLVSGGTTPYTYSWTGGGGSNEDISGLAPATYDVTISDANSCQITRSYTITQPSALTASATSIDVACFGNTNGSVNLTVGGGTAGYAYFWSDGSTTEDLSSLVAGVYAVTVSDANNCTKTASATVSEPSLLGIGVAVTSVNCFGGSDGGVLAVPSGGTSPYSYVWSSGSATTLSLSSLGAGTYTVTVTDASGCTSSGSGTVTAPSAALSVTETINTPPCNNLSGGSVTLAVSGGTTDYSYLWSDASTDQDLTAIASGTFTVTVTDFRGCTVSETYMVPTPTCNQPPVAVFETKTTLENTPVDICIHLNDTDPDNNLDTSTTTITVQPLHGTVVKSSTPGCWKYTPNPNYDGTDRFVYNVCDTGLPVYCDTAIVYITITPLVADLAIVKTSTATTYTAGNAVTWTITVTNNGPHTATAALVNDDINNALTNVTWTAAVNGSATVVNSSGTGDIVNQSVTIPAGSGNSVVYTVNATVPSSFTGNLVNTATVDAPFGTTDPDLTNNTDPETDTPAPVVDLVIDKSSAATTYTAGQTVTWTVTVTNNGPSDAIAALVNDDFNNALTGVTWTAAVNGGATVVNYSGSGDIVNQSVSVPAGSGNSVVYTITATVPSNFTGNLVNTATVTAPTGSTESNPSNNTDTETDTPDPKADLVIVKTSTSATYTPGTSVTWTITVTNNGPSDVTNAEVNDDVNNLLTGVSWTAVTTGGATVTNSSGSGDIVNELVSIPAGSGNSVIYTLTGLTPSSMTGNLVNTATVSVPTGVTDTNPTNNSDPETDTPAPVSDLVIAKSSPAGAYIPGGQITWIITVTNSGPSDAVNAIVNDDLDAALTNITWMTSTSGGATVTNSTGTGDIVNETVSIPAGSGHSVVYTVTANVPGSYTGNLANTATVDPPVGTTDPDLEDNEDTEIDPPAPVSDLVITKISVPTTYTAGESVSWTITVTNNGPSNVTGALVNDDFDDLLTNILWSAVVNGSASVANASGTGDITNELVTIPAGSGNSVVYTVTADVPSDYTGDLMNTATVDTPAGTTDPDPTNNTDEETDNPNPLVDMEIVKTSAATTYTAGGTVTWTVTVTNNGPSDAVGAKVSDDIDNALTNVTWTTSTSGSASVLVPTGTGDLVNQVVNIPAGSGNSVTYTITATVPSSFTGNLVNTATVAPPTGVTDTDNTNDSDPETDTPAPVSDLAIVKTSASSTYTPGGTVTWTITVTNNGPSDVVGAEVNDDINNSLTNVSWTAATNGTATAANLSGMGDLSGELVSIASGAGNSVVFTVTATVPSSFTGNLVNTATVAPPSGTTDPDLTNNSDPETDTPAPVADLAIVKTSTASTYTPGGTVTWTITVTNAGPSDAVNAMVNDNLNDLLTGVTWTAAANGSATVVNASGSGDLVNELVSIPAGAGNSVVYMVTATVPSNFTGDLVNTATVTPPTGTTDPDLTDNTDPETDTPDPVADLIIVKYSTPSTYVPGGSMTWVITVTNNGPSDAIGALVNDDFDNNLTNISWAASTSGGASTVHSTGTGDIVNEVVNIPAGPGNWVTYIVTASIPASFTGNLVNTTTITPPAGTTDPDISNNTDGETDTPSPEADLSIVKSSVQDSYVPGGTVTWTITVSNNGPSDVAGALVNDDFNNSLTNIIWTAGVTGSASV
ncbi:MAG: Ig-like domain-containing protein, partial [Bacteroidota bacterium]